MKKIFVVLVAFMILFTGCAKVEDMTNGVSSQKAEIEFNLENAAGPASRAIVTGTSFPATDEHFGVYGYVKPTAQISGGYIIKNGEYHSAGEDVGKPVTGAYYWPTADNVDDIKVNFVAWYPFNYSSVAFDSVNNELDFTLSAPKADVTRDLLYATVTDETPVVIKNTAAVDYNDKVQLTFHHALSLIEFQAKKEANQNITKVEITSIRFIDNNGLAWPIVTDGNFSINIDDDTAVTAISEGATTDSTYNFALESVKDSVLTTYSTLSDVIVIPQAVPAKVELTFNITITNPNGGDAIVYNGRTVTRVVNSGSDENNVGYVNNWVSGNKYIYRYNISASEVTFEVIVEDWITNDQDWQIWDHNATAYVEHFFGKASTQKGQSLAIA